MPRCIINMEIEMSDTEAVRSKNNERKKNLKTLIKIQYATNQAIHRYPTPKFEIAILIAVAVGFLYLVFCYLNEYPLRIFVAIGLMVSFGFFSYFMNRKPDSWVTVIDELLNEYAPLDKEKYVQLQTYTKEHGFDYHYIMEWANRERQNYLSGKREKLDFTERNL